MSEQDLAPRLRRLPRQIVVGLDVPVGANFRSRLLGLACLDSHEVGPGLLLPRCFSVHTFGMRFPLDLYFLDSRYVAIEIRREVGPGRFATNRNAAAVLEIPSGSGPGTAPLSGAVTDLVGEDRQGADAGLQSGREAQQGRIARVADAALQAADVRWVHVREVGERFLAQARFFSKPLDRGSESRVLGRARLSPAARGHR